MKNAMKARTVIILVICGALLLTVAAFGIFFARGGEFLYWYPYGWKTGAYPVAVSIEREDLAKEIAALDFTFELTPEMEIHFTGTGYKKHWITDTEKSTGPLFSSGTIIGERYIVENEVQLNGKVQYSFPWEEAYIEVGEEEFQERLTSEIEKRISPHSDFQVRKYSSDSGLWGEKRGELKTLPKK